MYSSKSWGRVCLMVTAVCLLVSTLAAEVRYGVAQLPGTTDANFKYSPSIQPMAVNSSGVVVGNVTGYVDHYYSEYGVWDVVEVERVFTWQPGMDTLHVIDPTGNVEWSSLVSAINDSGIAVGRRDIGSYDDEIYKWNTGTGQLTSLATPVGDLYHYPEAINNYGNGEVVAYGGNRTVYWDSAGAGQVLLPPGTGTVQQGLASDISNTGVIVGMAKWYRGTDGNGDPIYEEGPFKHLLATGNTYELPALAGGNSGEGSHVNDSGMIGGYTNIPRPTYPNERLEQPCYWDSSGTLHDLRDEFADWGSGSLITGAVLGLSADDTMLITAGWDAGNSWLFNPGTDEDVVLLSDMVNGAGADVMQYFTALKMADNGTMIGEGRLIDGGTSVNVLYTPYDVEVSSVAAGVNQTVVVNGGVGATGGCEVTFDNMTAAGSLATHYGQGPADNFAVTFLSDPADLDDVADNLLPGDAQFWSLDMEEGSYSGDIELTFQYDPALLPTGMDLDDLVVLHHTGDGWETLVPIAHDAVGHTITVQTDSLSPFLLGAVPEPTTLSLLATGLLLTLRKRRRQR